MIYIGKITIQKNDTRAKSIFIPASFIGRIDLNKQRLLVYIYLIVRCGLDNIVTLSINSLITWLGLKPNRNKGKINDQIKELLNNFIKDGYLLVNGEINDSNYFDVQLTNKMFDVNNSFALIYLDEIYSILKYKEKVKNVNLNIGILLLVFCYLRWKIPKRDRTIKNGLTKDEDKINKPEAYNCYYSDIAEYIGVNERSVSKAIDILRELNLIRYKTLPRKKKDNKWITCTTIFVNYYKRYRINDSIEEIRGQVYYADEIENKEKRFEKCL